MTTFTIKSREHGHITFFVRSTAEGNDSGYVFLGTGTDGKQICEGGDFIGSTLTATVESLGKVARKWHKQRMAACREYDMEYGD